MHSKNSHSIHIGSWWCKQQILSDSRCERTVLSRMLYSSPTARAGAHLCEYAIKRQADGERLEHFKIQHSMKWPIWKRERLVWGKEKTNKENKKSLLEKKKDGHTYCPLVLCWKKKCYNCGDVKKLSHNDCFPYQVWSTTQWCNIRFLQFVEKWTWAMLLP